LVFTFPYGGRHIEDDRLLVSTRNRRRDRIGGEQHVEAAPRRQMVGVADREIQPDHVVRQWHARIKRRRTGMIAELRAHPPNAGGAGLFDGHCGGTLHDEVPHAVIAIDQRRAGVLTHHMNVWPGIEAACPDTAGILRQTADAVSVRALQVRFRHQACNGRSIRVRQAQFDHRPTNERFQPIKCDPYFSRHDTPI
jgi:hypothetical protein